MVPHAPPRTCDARQTKLQEKSDASGDFVAAAESRRRLARVLKSELRARLEYVLEHQRAQYTQWDPVAKAWS